MIVRRFKTAVATVAAAAVLTGGGTAAYAALRSSPAPQVNSPDVYACVNPSGGIDYLEYRLPLPHPCWYGNETLWRWSVNPTPAPTVTATSG